jgi:uncharacterized membrane protein YhhN
MVEGMFVNLTAGTLVPVGVFAGLAALALASADGRWRLAFALAKPAATASLFLVAGAPAGLFAGLITAGIALSAAGDLALLSARRGAFLLGLGLFLGAHAAYAGAFLGGGGRAPWLSSGLMGTAVFAVATTWLLAHLWRGVERPLRAPAAVYGVAIVAMVGAAFLLLAGPWPLAVTGVAALGAVLFYLGDATLAWSLFRGPIPQAQTANLSLYWAGQLGVALAARLHMGGDQP